MNQTLNSSQGPGPSRASSGVDALTLAYLAGCFLAMVTCVCGIAGNGVVVWLLSSRMRKTPFCVYMLNLAVADILFLACMATMLSLETQPLETRPLETRPLEIRPLETRSLEAQSLEASLNSKAYEVVKRVKYFAYTAGLSLLTAISTQRCLSVLFPIWYKCHQPRHLSAVVCALLWGLSLLMNTLASFFCSRYWHHSSTQCRSVDMALSTLIMGVFTPVMTLTSVTIFVRVRRSSLLRRRRPRRLYVVILASIFVFLVCSLPLGIYWFFLYWVHLPYEVELLFIGFSRLSSAISSSANPVIYFLVGSQRSRRLGEPLRAVLDRALQEEPELEGKETPSTLTNEGI